MEGIAIKNLTDLFIDLIFEMSQSPIPDEVYDQAKKCVLDYIGVTIAGSKLVEGKFAGFLPNTKTGQTGGLVIGSNASVGLSTAAFVNGWHAHQAELDDGHRYGMIHLGAPIISPLIAIAGHKGISGKDFLRGIILGYEVAVRLAASIQPGHKQRGYHATGTCGTIGAALGLASALKFSKEKMKEMLSVAATSASGLLVVCDDKSQIKAYNAAKAAQDSIIALNVVEAGFAGPEDVLGSNRGFLGASSQGFSRAYLLENPYEGYCIKGIYFKPYAACRHAHPAIEAALKLRGNKNLNPHQIETVTVLTYSLAVEKHNHREVEGSDSARMSIPYSVAAAIQYGRVGIQEFSQECLESHDLLDLVRKVSVVADDELSEMVPKKRPATVSIKDNVGRLFSARVDYPKGEPENPMSQEEREAKFFSLADFTGIHPEKARDIIHSVYGIEEKINDLLKLVVY